jgi:hypothetical protein
MMLAAAVALVISAWERPGYPLLTRSDPRGPLGQTGEAASDILEHFALESRMQRLLAASEDRRLLVKDRRLLVRRYTMKLGSPSVG